MAFHAEEMLPPHNLQAEMAVLGSILLEQETIYTIAEIIKAEDFYKDAHKKIYETLFMLNEEGKNIDLVTFVEALQLCGLLEEIGSMAYVTELYKAVPTAANAAYYAQIVKDKAMKRNLIRISSRITQETLAEEKEAATLLEEAETEIFNLSQIREAKGLGPVAPFVGDAFDLIGVNEKGIPTFTELDTLLDGLKKSDLVIVAARPAMGKTTFCINIAEKAATMHGFHVAFFSLEMSNIQLAARMLFSHAKVDQSKAKRNRLDDGEWGRLGTAMEAISKAPLFLDDTPGITVSEVRGKARRLKREKGLDLIVIDYIQLMQSSVTARNENRQQQISEISRQLKGLAKELDVPVLAISQLSRAAVGKGEGAVKMPDLSHLRESGALEQDADIVIFIHRPAYYDSAQEDNHLAKIRVAKHRNGPVGEKDLAFFNEWTLFMDLDTHHDEPVYESGAEEVQK